MRGKVAKRLRRVAKGIAESRGNEKGDQVQYEKYAYKTMKRSYKALKRTGNPV